MEALHNVLKEELGNQSLDVVRFIENVHEKIFQRQENELVKAVRGLGEYRLAENFQELHIPENDWQEMTEDQRRARVKKIFNFPVENVAYKVEIQHEKQLLIRLEEITNVINLPFYVLKKIWRSAEYILNHGSTTLLPKGNFCVTDEDYGYNVCQDKNKKWVCSCVENKQTGGLCPHVLIVQQEIGELPDYLEHYSNKKGVLSMMIDNNAPARGGDKPFQQKKRRGANNKRTKPITSVVSPIKFLKGPKGTSGILDVNWDVPKQATHSEYWQNDELFFIHVNKGKCAKKAKTCTTCKRCFPKRDPAPGEGDIVIGHKERYEYPLKDSAGKTTKWVVTNMKKCDRFYCAKKKCILERHPYAWKGLLLVDEESKHLLSDKHYAYLFEELHYVY